MIDKVAQDCTGCFACGDKCPVGAISFRYKSDGFAYPVINNWVCTQCQLCEHICPILSVEDGYDKITSYASYAFSKPNESSSGGMFYAIACAVIRDNGVVYGAAFSNQMKLSHVRVTQVEELRKLCGSKYVQSDCSGIYKRVQNDLKTGTKVLFSGTPCQVSGLKKFLHKNYESLYTIDLICHGVPSPGVFSDWIHYCENLRKKTVVEFLTRDNRDGWDNRFRSTLIYMDGKQEYNSMLSNLWNRVFFSELATRKSCSNCKFARLSREGDITLGDFWGVEKVSPESFNKEGVSFVQVNTDKGQAILNSISDHVKLTEASTTEKEHPNLYHPTHANPQREQFMYDYSQHGFEFVIKRYFGYTRWLDLKIRVKALLNNLIKK